MIRPTSVMTTIALTAILTITGCGTGDRTPTNATATTDGTAVDPDPTAPGGTTTPSDPTTTDAQPTSSSAVTTTDVPTGPAWMVLQIGTPTGTGLLVVDHDGNEVSEPGAELEGSNQTNPDWSPDGHQITFGMTSNERDDLWIVDADGQNPTMLYDCADDCEYVDDPAWSPDGSSIAVCLMRSVDGADIGSLALVDVATGTISELADFEPTDFCAGPRWSPDGASIVLEIVHRSGTTLADDVTGVILSVISTSSGDVIKALTDPSLFAATADWNPVTNEIVYSALGSPDASQPDLYAIQPDGTGKRQLTNLASAGGAATEPSVDPDGTNVVFVASGAPSPLMVVDLETLELEPVFTTPRSGNHPRHRPQPID